MYKIFCVNKIIFSFFLVISLNAISQSVKDPSWEKMIDSSAIIVEGEIISSSNYECKIKIKSLLKGSIDAKEISISGLSERGGKTNYLKVGDTYMFFLLPNNDGFKVWSTSAGFLKIEKKKIQYDLFQTSFHVLQEFYSLKHFEKFILSCTNSNVEFNQKLIKLIESKILYDEAAQYILMLKINGYDKYESIFLESVYNENQNVRIALARYLGGLKDIKAQENLISLLSSDEEIVAEEAAIQLANFNNEITGEALLRRLKRTEKNESLISSNGILNQLQIKLINSLVKLNFTPAGNEISSILKTNNKSTFIFALDAVSNLKSTNYAQFLNEHYTQKDSILYDLMINHILEFKVIDSRKILFDFVSNINKSDSSYNYLVSNKGLGIFSDSITHRFIIDDFNKSLDSTLHINWFESYLDYIGNDSTSGIKDSIYNYIKNVAEIDFDVINSTKVFEIDSVKNEIQSFPHFEIFLKYLSKTGTLEDLILIHKIEAKYLFNKPEKALLEKYLRELEEVFK